MSKPFRKLRTIPTGKHFSQVNKHTTHTHTYSNSKHDLYGRKKNNNECSNNKQQQQQQWCYDDEISKAFKSNGIKQTLFLLLCVCFFPFQPMLNHYGSQRLQSFHLHLSGNICFFFLHFFFVLHCLFRLNLLFVFVSRVDFDRKEEKKNNRKR